MMTPKIRLADVSFTKFKTMLDATKRLMAEHTQRYLQNVPDDIARLKGMPDYAMLERAHTDEILFLRQMMSSPDQARKGNLRELFNRSLVSEPGNYCKALDEFDHLDVTLQLLFGEAQFFGVQLAANFGPYLHFAKHHRPGFSLCGIDPDPTAVRYAGQLGVEVRQADATNLPFGKESVDAVFSQNFLEEVYCQNIAKGSGDSSADEFRQRVLAEVARILRPGGWFISDHEFTLTDLILIKWPKGQQFEPHQFSSDFSNQFGLDRLVAFRKVV